MPPTERREEDCKSSKYSFFPIEGFLSLCELAMNLSSHLIILSWKERSSSDMVVNLIFFQVHQKSELICELKISFDLLYNSEYSTQNAFIKYYRYWICKVMITLFTLATYVTFMKFKMKKSNISSAIIERALLPNERHKSRFKSHYQLYN